jgi:hypothetical protein
MSRFKKNFVLLLQVLVVVMFFEKIGKVTTNIEKISIFLKKKRSLGDTPHNHC